MSTAFSSFGDLELPEALAKLRTHAAMVRALLDELDRLAPSSARSSDAACLLAVGEQMAEEFGRLGRHILDCAAAMTAEPAKGAAAR